MARLALSSLLWPERPEREAVSALRHALANLRGALGNPGAPSPILLITRASVQLNPAAGCWLDVAEFEDLLDLTGLDQREDLSGLTTAVELYRGPFLHGLSLPDSPAFDEWMLFKGEEYRRRVLSLLEQLAALRLARGDTAEAARWARRQLELEPYREPAHRHWAKHMGSGHLAIDEHRQGEVGHGQQQYPDQFSEGAIGPCLLQPRREHSCPQRRDDQRYTP